MDAAKNALAAVTGGQSKNQQKRDAKAARSAADEVEPQENTDYTTSREEVQSLPERSTPTDDAFRSLMKLVTGFSIADAESRASVLLRETNQNKRIDQLSLAAIAIVVQRKAYRDALPMFPDTPFKKAVTDACGTVGTSGDMNFSAMNAIGWLVFSSGATLRPGLRAAIQKKAGGTSWSEATFSGFSKDAKSKEKDAKSATDIAKQRRDSYGVEAIKSAESRLKALAGG